MKIVYDEPKRQQTLAARGMDFADLTIEFFERAAIVPAKVSRFKAVGEFSGKLIAVIFKPLGYEALSVISMRRANQDERNDYERYTR
jgi:uncharacterized protein